MTESRSPMSLRTGLRRLATGLIAYGVIGLVLAVIAAIALVWAGGRLDAVGARVETKVADIAETLDRTATVLADASASADSFAVTLERTPPIVRQAAQIVADLETDLRTLSSQFASVQIVGRQPLAGVATVFDSMASNLDGLDARLGLIATDLESNKAALLANADSLAALGDQLGVIADDLQSGTVEDSLDDLKAVITVLSFVLLVWIVIPAAGALGLGWWLRREVGVEDD